MCSPSAACYNTLIVRRSGVLGSYARSVPGCAALACGLLALLLVSGRADAAARAGTSFAAHGSVEQVYATGVGSRAHGDACSTAAAARSQTKGATGSAASSSATCAPARATGSGSAGTAGARGRCACSPSGPRRPAPRSTTSRSRPSGYGYLTTRDGTQLAIDVHQPQGAGGGPTPTLIEYSGYGYANPAGPESGLAPIANLLGFAVVDVNMRGTGCSGGAFDYFEPLQSLDGYDVIETVARQPWVANHQVGMMGISYGGISQLFTAATRPPSLAAIAPLSVLDSTQTTLYPGGILNTGFAVPWAKERVEDAKPASAEPGPAVGLQADPGRRPDLPRQPGPARARRSTCWRRSGPTATTGPRSPTRSRRSPSSTRSTCRPSSPASGPTSRPAATARTSPRASPAPTASGSPSPTAPTSTRSTRRPPTAGTTSSSSTSPGRRRSSHAASIRAGASLLYAEAMGIARRHAAARPGPGSSRPTKGRWPPSKPSRRSASPSTTAPAAARPGQPLAGFEQSFAASRSPAPKPAPGSSRPAAPWPRQPRRPAATPTASAGTPRALPRTDFSGDTGSGSGGLWTATPSYRLDAEPARQRGLLPERAAGRGHDRDRRRRGQALGPLLGPQRRPAGDGQRGPPRRHRDLRPERLGPRRRAQARPQEEHPAGTGPQPAQVRRQAAAARPLRPGHDPALLRGPRLPGRLADPADDRRAQRDPAGLGFAQTRPKGTAKVAIAYSRKMPSKLLLPVVPGVSVPTGLPPCPGLRGQPCRPYQPFANRAAKF